MSKVIRTKARVIEGVIECISKKGIEHASVTEIARTAKVTRSLVSYYLPQKKDVFREVMEYLSLKIREGVDEATLDHADPIEALVARVRANLEFFIRNPKYFQCYNLFYYYAGVHKEFRDLNTVLASRAREKIRIQLEKGASAEKRVPLDSMELATIVHDVLVRTIQRHQIERATANDGAYVEDKTGFFRRWLPKLIREQSYPVPSRKNLSR